MQTLAASFSPAVATRPATRATRAPPAGRVAMASNAAAPEAARLSMRSSVSNTCALRAQQPMQTSASRASVKVHAGFFDRNKTPGKYGKTVIITGASSGLGLATAQSLIDQETHYVICAVRNVEKMEEIAEEAGWDKKAYRVMPLQLDSLQDCKAFVQRFRKLGKTLDCLCCNAAVYLPNQPGPTWTEDGFEESVGVNHLSHFLLCNLMISDLKKSKEPRCIIVGSITGNTNTVGGGAVKPFADLGDLKGLARGLVERDGEMRGSSMMDGAGFNGAKAYKDSKLANMMTILELHRRYHDDTGIVFTSMYPGCIAETALFRQKRTWFRKFFPVFMKYVTGGYVSEEEAGDRLAQCINSPDTLKSGVYWSWNGGARTVGVYDPKKKTVVGAGGSGGELFENRPSAAVKDEKKGKLLWDYSMAAVESYM